MNAVLAADVLGKVTVKVAAGPAATAIEAEVPVRDGVDVSWALMVWVPAVTRVAGNDPVPLVSVVFAGRVADGSVLVKPTVPV